MSRNFGSAGKNTRNNNRKRIADRRREVLGSYRSQGTLDGVVPAVVQRLEDRILLANPVLTILGTPSVYTGTPVSIIPASGGTSLISTANLQTATITLGSRPDGTNETFTNFASLSDVQPSLNLAGNVLTLQVPVSNPAGITAAAMLADLKAIQYVDSPTTTLSNGTRTFNFTVTDIDGNSQTGGNPTATVSVPVAKPDLTITGPFSQFTGAAPVFVIPTNSGTSIDSTVGATYDNIYSATITLTSNPDSPLERLSVPTYTDVIATPSTITTTVTLTATTPNGISPAAMLADLEQVAYNDTAAHPSGLSRSFTISLTDAGTVSQSSNPTTSTVNFVQAVPPTVTITPIPNFFENVTQPITGITVADTNPSATDTVTLSVLRGTLVLTSPAQSGSTITITGTPSTINSELQGLTYRATPGSSEDSSNQQRSDTLTVTALSSAIGSNGPQSATATATLPVQPVADLGVVVSTPTTSIGVLGSVTYSIQVTNNGPDIATGTKITNAFTLAGFNANFAISGLTLVSSTNPSQSITSNVAAAGSVAFTFSQPFLTGDTATVSVVVTPQIKGSLTSSVSFVVNQSQGNTAIPVTNPSPVTVVDNGVLSLLSTSPFFPIPLSGSQSFAINVNRSTVGNESPDGIVTVAINLSSFQNYGSQPGQYTLSVNGSPLFTSPNLTSTITFADGQSVVPITVTVNGTNQILPNVTFTLSLSTPITGGATLASSGTSVNETLVNQNKLVVTNTYDTLDTTDPNYIGSLRQILAAAEADSHGTGSAVPIQFDIPAVGNQTTFEIDLVAPLEVTDPVLIVGSSQPGSTATPPSVILIKPSSTLGSIYSPTSAAAITFDAASTGSTLSGVEVMGFPGDAIDLLGDSISIQSCKIDSNTGAAIYARGSFETIGGVSSTFGNTISGSGTRPLVSISGSNAGIQVLSNSITLDNAGGVGISVTGSSGVIVGQNMISGTSGGVGIRLTSDSGILLTNNTIGNTLGGTIGTGIDIGSLTLGTSIVGSTITGSTVAGIKLETGTGSAIHPNVISGLTKISTQSGDGIDVLGDTGDMISGFIIAPVSGGSLVNGIHLESGANNTSIAGGTISGSTQDGILISSGTNNTVSGTTILTNTDGIEVNSGSGNTLAFFTISPLNSITGLANGIVLDGGTSNNSISGGSITGSTLNGIAVGVGSSGNTADSTTIAGTTISPTNGYGISVNSVSSSSLLGTTITGTNIQGINTVSAGILLNSNSSDSLKGNTVENNVSGVVVLQANLLSLTGNTIMGNLVDGLVLTNINGGTIGGTAAGAGNVISANLDYGIEIKSSSNLQILGNKIGTNAAGTDSTSYGNGMHLGFSGAGIYLNGTVSSNTIGGYLNSGAVVGQNVISGNYGTGILINGPGVTGELITNNYIGTDGKGGRSLGNQQTGILVLNGAHGETIVSNVISGNVGEGVFLDGSSSNSLTGNKIGTNALGNASVPNGVGVQITGTGTNTIGGSTAAAGNVISGNSTAGILVNGAGSVAGLIQGNYIGTDVGGTIGLQVQQYGVEFQDLTGGTIGGTLPSVGGTVFGAGGTVLGVGNVISGNTTYGVYLLDSSNIAVQGNIIGANSSETGVVPNGTPGATNLGAGVYIGGNSTNNTIGGSANGAQNVISGNTGAGISIQGAGAANEQILDNYIGTNPASATNLGNTMAGILIGSASNFSKSSGDSIVKNTISGNSGNGISSIDSPNLTITSNYITANSDGIFITNDGNVSSNDSLSSNFISNNIKSGVEFNGPVVATTSGDLITANQGDGLLITGGSLSFSAFQKLTISDTIQSNTTNGLELQTTQYYTVNLAGSTIESNDGNGIKVDTASSNNTITFGTITGNFENGVEILSGISSDSVSNNRIQNVTASNNKNNGILISGEGAGSNTLSGVITDSNKNNGISIQGAGNSNQIVGSTITNNTNNGISVSNGTDFTVIGTQSNGGLQSNGNIVSSNDNYGISIDASSNSIVIGNVVSDNFSNGVVISGGGTKNTLAGNTIEGNFLAGVLVSASSGNSITNQLPDHSTVGNVIVGNNTDGVDIFGSTTIGADNNTVVGNFIGTNQINKEGMGNQGDGIHLVNADNNTIGGTAQNIISANKGSGVEIFGDSSNNQVTGNVIGTITGDSNLGNKLDGVLISGSAQSTSGSMPTAATDPTNNTIGGSIAGSGNVISGNQENGVAINLADSNFVLSNLIGVVGGGGSLPNILSGVSVSHSNGNIIGEIGAGNLIGGNQLNGIGSTSTLNEKILFNAIASNIIDGISSASTTGDFIYANQIFLNHFDGIGLDGSNGATIGANTVSSNFQDGIRLQNTSNSNFIGTPSSPNTILGNSSGAGVELSSGSTGDTIANNLIGFSTSSSAASNGNLVGVYLNQVQGNLVGGASDYSSANTITGNKMFGVLISGNPSGTSTNNGNTIAANYIGTDNHGLQPTIEEISSNTTPAYSSLTDADPSGSQPPAAFSTSSDVGVYVLNSTDNSIQGNIASGNHLAGIELFGSLSTSNTVSGNIVGAGAGNSVIVTNPSLGDTTYSNPAASSAIRQDYGIWINDAPKNIIDGMNKIESNQVGIQVEGGNASGNMISGNLIGNTSISAGLDNLSGLANFFGIYINNSPYNTIQQNTIKGNISVGVAIDGTSAQGNQVINNPQISLNGAYGQVTVTNQTDKPTSPPVTLEPRAVHERVFGNGVYINAAQGNTVSGNMILDNYEAGVYIYNFGSSVPTGNITTGTPILADVVQSNTIGATTYAEKNSANRYDSEYGILLFNSAGDISSTPTSGAGANTLRNAWIAPFFPYNGPANFPIDSVPNSTSTAQTTKVNVQKVKAAAIGNVPVTINTGGKGHPQPPVSKKSSRKS